MLASFSDEFWQGDGYPRWFASLNAGYGSPAGIFYGPLYMIALLPFGWMSSIDPSGFIRLMIGVWLALMVSGYNCRYWLKHWFSAAQAEKGALLYAGFPYLLYLIYFHYAIAALWAIAIFPLILAAIDKARTILWQGVPLLAFSIALLLLAHIPSFLTFVIVPPAYAFFMAAPGQRLRQLLLVGVGGVLGALLCTAYWLPMMQNMAFIKSEFYTSDHGHYNMSYTANFFLSDTLFGLCIIILPLIGLYFEQPKKQLQKSILFWGLILSFLLFMVSPFSKMVWASITILQKLQFPFRFYNAMLPGAVFIATSWLVKAKSRYVYICLFIFMQFYTSFSAWQSWFSDEPNATTHKAFIGIGPTWEYQTRWMGETRLDSPVPHDFGLVTIVEGKGEARVGMWQSREITLHADMEKGGGQLVLHRFYFPGWAGEGVAIEPSDGTQSLKGLLSLHVTEGSHDVKLTWGALAGERLGRWISLLTLSIILLQLIRPTELFKRSK